MGTYPIFTNLILHYEEDFLQIFPILTHVKIISPIMAPPDHPLPDQDCKKIGSDSQGDLTR
jgi:hypothetical protein